jgi:hypothetical protein
LPPVRAIDLDDLDLRGTQVPGETGAIGAGALHADGVQDAEGAHPFE